MEVGVGELRDLLDRHVPLLALEVLALLLALGGGGQGHGQHLAGALDVQLDRRVDRQRGEAALDGGEIGLVHPADRLAVDRDRDVAGVELGLLAGGAFVDAGDQDAVLGVDVRALAEILQGLEPEARPGAGHLPVLQDALDHVPHDRRGDREAQVVGAPHAAGVDADNAAADVDERPARVARVDGGVGLDPEVVGRQVEVALDRGDDAAGDRALEAVGCPHGHDELADLEGVGVPELRDRQGSLGLALGQVQLDHGEVGLGVEADDLGADLLLVGEDAADLGGLLGDVVVGDHVALGRDDGPGAEDLDLFHLAAAELLLDRLDEDHGREDLVLGLLDDFLFGARGGAAQREAEGDRGDEDSHGAIVSRGSPGVNVCAASLNC